MGPMVAMYGMQSYRMPDVYDQNTRRVHAGYGYNVLVDNHYYPHGHISRHWRSICCNVPTTVDVKHGVDKCTTCNTVIRDDSRYYTTSDEYSDIIDIMEP